MDGPLDKIGLFTSSSWAGSLVREKSMNSFEEIILYYLQLLFLPFLQFKAVQVQDFSFNTVSMSDTAARVSRVVVSFGLFRLKDQVTVLKRSWNNCHANLRIKRDICRFSPQVLFKHFPSGPFQALPLSSYSLLTCAFAQYLAVLGTFWKLYYENCITK